MHNLNYYCQIPMCLLLLLTAGGAVWAAQRVEDDQAVVISNGFIIRTMTGKHQQFELQFLNLKLQ